MKAVSLWSGGKDSCLACYEARQQGLEIASVFNFTDPDTGASRSHGLSAEIIRKQLAAVDSPSLQKPMPKEGYRRAFIELIDEWKADKGIEAVVFGDIYLREHKDWIEKVCDESKVRAVFPLWGRDTAELLAGVIAAGFRAIVVSVRTDLLGREWLGRQIDAKFLKEITALGNIDPCGEKGEYHTFVYDGPLFRKPVEFTAGRESLNGKRGFLELLPGKN